MGDLGRTRLVAAIAVPLTVAAGLGLRAVGSGEVAKYGGTALYTALVYTLVTLARPRLRPFAAATGALAFSWAVELSQLTGVPAEWAGRSVVARLVLGSTFNAPDLLWYAAGAGSCWAIHTSLRRLAPAARAAPPGATAGRSPGP